VRRGAATVGQLLAAVLTIGTTAAVAKRSIDHARDDARERAQPAAAAPTANLAPGGTGAAALSSPADTAPQTAPSAGQALGTYNVRNLQGKLVPLATKGEPAIVMVSSRTCSWCKRTLKDLGEMSAGRPLPRLKLLTLEGAAEGIPMLAKEGLTGVQMIGPAGSSDQVLLTFRYPGTPTFVAIDRNGRVVQTMPGYPIRQVLQHWYAVMVGDADTP
jgi:hypothetical protein